MDLAVHVEGIFFGHDLSLLPIRPPASRPLGDTPARDGLGDRLADASALQTLLPLRANANLDRGETWLGLPAGLEQIPIRLTRHCEPTGPARSGPMTGSAKQSRGRRTEQLDCFVAPLGLLAMTALNSIRSEPALASLEGRELAHMCQVFAMCRRGRAAHCAATQGLCLGARGSLSPRAGRGWGEGASTQF